jgi:hypothetical protein
MGGMEKTTVYLTSAQKAALARTAAQERRSEATLIRAGVDVVTARHRTGESPAQIASAGEDPAQLGSGTGDQRLAIAATKPRWIARDAFVRAILGHPADPGLRVELREMAPDTTDEQPLR